MIFHNNDEVYAIYRYGEKDRFITYAKAKYKFSDEYNYFCILNQTNALQKCTDICYTKEEAEFRINKWRFI